MMYSSLARRAWGFALPFMIGLGLTWVVIKGAQASQAAQEQDQKEYQLGFWPRIQEDLIRENGVRLLEADSQGLTLELATPDFVINQILVDGRTCQFPGIEGYAESDRSGWPRLPVTGAMLGIPADVNVKLDILEAARISLGNGFRVCPVATPITEMGVTGEVRYLGEETHFDAQAYSMRSMLPSTPAELIMTGFIRSQRVAQVRFQPFQYNPITGELIYFSRIRVRLSFTASMSPEREAGNEAIDEGAFEPVLQASLLNYEQARQYRSQTAPSIDSGESFLPQDRPLAFLSSLQADQDVLKILVDREGIYQLTYNDLTSAGMSLDGVDPRYLQMRNRGQEVAILVIGEEDGSFNSQDYILFYGQSAGTKYADVNVYWLQQAEALGQRMPVLDGTPEGTNPIPDYFLNSALLEENLIYLTQFPNGPDKDRYYWHWVLRTSAPLTFTYSFDLQNIYNSPISATVKGWFFGYTANPQHHHELYLNDHLVEEAFWPSRGDYLFEIDAPQSILVEGPNTITLKVPTGSGINLDYFVVNKFEVDYYDTFQAVQDFLAFDGETGGTWNYQITGYTTSEIETYDVSQPLTPKTISNASILPEGDSYRVSFDWSGDDPHRILTLSAANHLNPLAIIKDESSNLRSPLNAADYIVITHPDFYTDVLPLVNFRAQQGLRTFVANVYEIYDEFSYGLFDPEAIRQFLGHAYNEWIKPAPMFVLLVGDGNHDFKDEMGFHELNYIPPYLAEVDPWLGETASENKYVSVSGGDILADMYLGRLPVKTPQETAALVTKILEYEQNQHVDEWNKRLLFVADNADSAGDFAALSNAVADNLLPHPYQARKVYYRVTHPNSTAAREAILSEINQGVLMVNYIGHAGYNLWAGEGLLRNSDIASLTNIDRLPFISPMTCLEGYFFKPSSAMVDNSSLAESLIRAVEKGAIGSFSPTGLGVATGHDFLDRGLYEAILHDYVAELGPATAAAKLYLFSNTGAYRELIETYVLFGDPATRLHVLRPEVGIKKLADSEGVLYPEDWITFTLSYSNTGERSATGAVIRDILPDGLLNSAVTFSGATINQRPGSLYIWDLAELSPAEGGIITITAQIAPNFQSTITNTASIEALGDLPESNNNSSWVVTHVVQDIFLPLIYDK